MALNKVLFVLFLLLLLGSLLLIVFVVTNLFHESFVFWCVWFSISKLNR